MLAQVRQLHQELLALLDEVDFEAGRAEPDVQRLTSLRWKLGRAAGKRMRLMEEQIFPLLLDRVGGEEARKVRELRDTNLAAASAMSEHIGKWTLEAVTADWEGYRRTSAGIRERLRERIAAEFALLYPLLARVSAAAS